MVSPIPDKVCPSGALIIIIVSTMIAVGILQAKVFRALPYVSSTEKGEASESLLSDVGIQM